MYPASRESATFGDQAMMRSAHTVPNNFVRSYKTDRFPEPGLLQADQPLCHQSLQIKLRKSDLAQLPNSP
jgi:hypothetical protein